MRIFALLFFALLGVAAGLAAATLFRGRALALLPSAAVGVIGAFAGLLTRDLFNLAGGIGAGVAMASLGAALLALLANGLFLVLIRR